MAKKSLENILNSQFLSLTFLAYGIAMVFIRQVAHPYILVPVLSLFGIALFAATYKQWRAHLPLLLTGAVFTLFIQAILPLPYSYLVTERSTSQGVAMACSITAVALVCIGLAWFTQRLLAPSRRNP